LEVEEPNDSGAVEIVAGLDVADADGSSVHELAAHAEHSDSARVDLVGGVSAASASSG
jgi:hypothetical protein